MTKFIPLKYLLIFVVGLFVVLGWAGLPSAVIGPTVLRKEVEIGPIATRSGSACAQTMPRLPGVCLRQAELFQMSHGR